MDHDLKILFWFSLVEAFLAVVEVLFSVFPWAHWI
jgi:hypothetical protein